MSFDPSPEQASAVGEQASPEQQASPGLPVAPVAPETPALEQAPAPAMTDAEAEQMKKVSPLYLPYISLVSP